ncbi:Hint domain-containing protein [Octadecabacter sp. R77987]|uniref:Hint domain-containing protein n=1 Tax=Octadecabacter sp. R77987 TaxID=3093874 RepID=UPI003670A311
MPTSYTDQFFLMDPANPPAGGTALNYVNYTLVDQNNDNDFDRFDNDSVNGSDIQSSYPGDTVTINVAGVGNVTYTGITFYLANGQRVFTPTDGQALQNGTFVSSTWVNGQGPLLVSQLGPPCFVAGTLIETDQGLRPVEELAVGDLLVTQDNGLQPLVWTGHRAVVGQGDFAPIRFAPGALGNDRALLVSPQHRVLISGWRAELFFGEDEVFVAAKHLVNGDTIHQMPTRHVSYHHVMCEKHEVIFAEGIATETFFPGDVMMDGDPELRAEIIALFPEFATDTKRDLIETARCVLRGREASVLSAPLAA